MLLLHYLGKLKVLICLKFEGKSKENAWTFLHAPILLHIYTYLLLAYLLIQFLVSIKYFFK